MLTVNLLELLRGGLWILFVVQEVETLVVELVRGLVGREGILVEHAACGKGDDERRKRKQAHQRASAALEHRYTDETPIHGFPVPQRRLSQSLCLDESSLPPAHKRLPGREK